MMSMMIVIRIEGYGDADFFSGLGSFGALMVKCTIVYEASGTCIN